MLEEKYISVSNKMRYICSHHPDNIAYITYNDFQQGMRCPYCMKRRKTSKAESEISSYIKSIYNDEISLSNRNILNGKELDIYLPDIKLAIEYNGFYYHSLEHGRENINNNYHLNKYIYYYI